MKYEPVFKIAYANVFITDLFMRSYANSNPVVTIKNRKWEFFLPQDILEKHSEQGFEFALDGNKYKEFENRYSFFKERVKKLRETNLERLGKEEFLKFLDEFKEVIVGFRDTYKETEFFYFTKIEKELNEYIKGKCSFQDLLSNRVEIGLWPEKIRRLADYIIGMQHLKFEYRKMFNEVVKGKESSCSKLLQQLVARTGREDATSMTINEVKDCLNGKEVKDVSDRHVYSYIKWDEENKKLIIYSGGDAYRKIRELDQYIPENEVIGAPACKGFVRGEVKVILRIPTNYAEFLLKIKEGYILVSDTTGPEMIALIEKAAAIVTDEGGMMSHAAILSREFNIPCVVGTKYATKVFEDGDLIEVNANNGVVRKV